MRRFRFVGDPSDYRIEGFDPPFKVGEVYEGSLKDPQCISSVQEYADSLNDEDWQEVFDEKPMITDSPLTFTSHTNPLHKDTDLGLFSAMILSEIGNNPNYKLVPKIKLVSESIELAKELIKQLDKGSANNPATH